MALISIKNLATPFTNKVHLGTIVFTVLLFVTFRAAGGAFSLKPSSGALRQGSETSNVKFQFEDTPVSMDEIDPRNELKRLGLEPRRESNKPREDLLRSMTGQSAGNARSAPANQDKTAPGTDLSELERRLGIR